MDLLLLRSFGSQCFNPLTEVQAGRSNAGDVGLLRLPALLPSAPARLTVSKITRTGFHLGWLPPEEDGGSPVDQYTVEMQPLTPAAVSQGIPEDWCRIHWSKVYLQTHLHLP